MMKRQKVYTVINILGLALGICACLVIFLITSYEFSFDRFHPEKEKIYRITGETTRVNGEKEFMNSVVPDVAGIEREIPGFEAKAAIHHYEATVKVPTDSGTVKSFYNENVIVTPPDYFRIFTYEWLAGNPATALQQANSVVISEKMARMYFGNTNLNNITGSTLLYNDSLQLKVTGVVKDWNEHTDHPYTDFISLSTASQPFLKKDIPALDWSGLRPHASMAFVKLTEHASASGVNALLALHLKKNPNAAFFGKVTKLQLQPLTDIHFTHEYHRADDGDGFRKAHLPTLYALMAIAVFILIIAAINFINLSTALSIHRSKEIGMRKVLGVGRKSLVFQLLTETFLFTALAVIISALLINPVIELFRSFIPLGVSFSLTEPGILIFLAAITIITTLFAGFYPANVLSSYRPAWSLKGTHGKASDGKSGLRKGLIVFQFSISLIFIIGTLVINSQINYMRTKDKGFKTDAILTINNWGSEYGTMKVLAERIRQVPGVEKAILQGDAPMGFAERSSTFKHKGKYEVDVEVILKTGDKEFIPFYDIRLISGRNLLPGDSLKEVIINEACAKAIGYANPSDAVGKYLQSGNIMLPVVGVVSDFHMGSLQNTIKPMAIQHVPEWESGMAIGLMSKGRDITQTKKIISQIETQWKAVYPQHAFEYHFLDESIGWLFEKEEQTAWLMNAAMIITIFISCMGLFGLAMYTAERRTREIGIRKVLGASVMDITTLLSRDFAKLVLIAAMIASPVAWLMMNRWLNDFAYRINISLWIFVTALLIGFILAMLTVSYQAIKAGLANPVNNLRAE